MISLQRENFSDHRIREQSLLWISEQFLKNRKQKVAINELFSQRRRVNHRISSKDPALFNLFINCPDLQLNREVLRSSGDSKLFGMVKT